MKKKLKKLYIQQKKRSLKKVIGTLDTPRLSVFRSNKHIYAQLIDDTNRKTLASSSTKTKEFKINNIKSNNEKASFLVGEFLAIASKKREIIKVVFDKGNLPYKGRIKALANGARKGGLYF
jgi:large subunit ribosomal protein L18